MLLHLQLPLPLDTDGPHGGLPLGPAVQELPVALLADVHALAEGGWQGTGLLDVGCGGVLGLVDVGY